MKRLHRTLLTLTAAGALGACGDDVTQVTGNALVQSADEPAGENCPNGGTALSAGIDRNEDGVLGPDEIDSTTWVCDGASGALVTTTPEPVGANCADGGIAITTGVDANGDGDLSGDEVANVAYACATSPETVPLTTVSDESAGENCEFGGVRIDVGVDIDGDDALDGDEIGSTTYACYPDGTGAELLSADTFVGESDDNCATGYVSTSIGLDLDGDETLDEDEQTLTTYRCNARPAFEGPFVLDVDDCGEDFTFEVSTSDVDDAVETVTIEAAGSGAATTLVDNGDGTATLPAGAHEGGMRVRSTATDTFGATRTQSYVLRFTGDGCAPLRTFYGVDPDSCVEVEIDPEAGDDRGSAIATASYVFYNGDDSLIRTSLDLSTIEEVVFDGVDTLFYDAVTDTLYTLWSTEFSYTDLEEAGGALDAEGSLFDQIAVVDQETLAVSGIVDLEYPVVGDNYVEFTIAEQDLELYVYDTLLGASDGRFVVAMSGEDDVSSDDATVLLVFDLATGDVLSELVLDPGDDDYYELQWANQETEIVTNTVTIRDGEEFIIIRSDDDSEFWYELGARSGALTLLSETYARTCDSDTVSVDYTTLTATGHAEDGCFVRGIDESLFRCGLLFAPNDGSVDDSGIWEDEGIGPR